MFSNNFSFNEGIDVELPLVKISLKKIIQSFQNSLSLRREARCTKQIEQLNSLVPYLVFRFRREGL